MKIAGSQSIVVRFSLSKASVLLLQLMLAAVVSPFAQAEVQSTTEHGFVSVHEREVNASPASLYQAVARIDQWWEASHTYSGNSSNLSLDLRPGGLFLEELPNGGFVEHLRVTTLLPGRLIRLTGGLGPLATDGLAGTMTWNFADGDSPEKSKLIWRYSVGGYRPDGFKELANAVDSVLAVQVDRLVKLAEQQAVADQIDPQPVVASGGRVKPVTAHTYTRDDGFVPPEATIEQFAFISGRWTGEAMGGWCEEVWSKPAGGEMQGMFQFLVEDKVQFRELLALQKNDSGNWQMRLKHFDQAMKGWEEKDELKIFELLEVSERRAIFDGLTIELLESGKLMAYVRSKDSNGLSSELTFEYDPS